MGAFYAVMWATDYFVKTHREPFYLSIRFDVACDTILEDLACFTVEHNPTAKEKAARWIARERTDGDGMSAREWQIVRDDGVFALSRLQAPDKFTTRFQQIREQKEASWRQQLDALAVVGTSVQEIRTISNAWPGRVLKAASNRLGLTSNAPTQLEKIVDLLEQAQLDQDFSVIRDSYVNTLLAEDSNREITHWALTKFNKPQDEIPFIGTLDIDRMLEMRTRMESAFLSNPIRYIHVLYQAGVFARVNNTLG
jgi:hypothetical protein